MTDKTMEIRNVKLQCPIIVLNVQVYPNLLFFNVELKPVT